MFPATRAAGRLWLPHDIGVPRFYHAAMARPRSDPYDALRFAAVAVLVGLAAGAGAILFWTSVEQIHRLLFGAGLENLHTIAAGLPWWQLLLGPAAGGLVVGVFIDRVLLQRRPHGVVDVIQAAALRGGYIPSRNGAAAAAASAASLGCGASVGPEGPVVHLGATLGSWIARLARIPQARVRRLIGCGVAAGIAASFNAPIAGAVFAIEVVVGKYTLHTFAPIAISTVVGTSISQLYFGNEPAFSLPGHAPTSIGAIPVYAALGIASAAVAIAFISSIAVSERLFTRARCPRWLRPAVAGLALGAIAIAVPQVLGSGTETATAALNEGLSLRWLAIILLAKLLATGLCIGGGFGGGVFSPSLFAGAMAGGAFGAVVEMLFPGNTVGYSACAVVGMGAVAGAVLGAPLSTTLIVFEMTGDYALTLAVLLATIISSVLVNDLWGRTFFQWQMEQRGTDLTLGHAEQLARQARIGELLQKEFVRLPATATRKEAIAALEKGHPVCIVSPNDGHYMGLLSERALLRSEGEALTAAALARAAPALDEKETLASAVARSGQESVTVFPVLASGSKQVVGVVSVKQLLNAYQGILDRVAHEERSFGG